MNLRLHTARQLALSPSAVGSDGNEAFVSVTQRGNQRLVPNNSTAIKKKFNQN